MMILVTGGAGFIGTHTVLALRARGDDVRVLDAFTEPVHQPGWTPALPADVEVLRGDVRDADAWARALEGADAVVHLAAYQDYLTDFSRFFAVNATGTALLYETIVARRLPVRRVVIASSQSVYGEGAARCSKDGLVVPEQRDPDALAKGDWDVRCPICGGPVEPAPTPEQLADPRNAYGISKLAAEHVAQRYATLFGLPLHMCRLASVYGPMDRDTPGRVVKCAPNVMMHRALAGKPWTVHAPTGVGDWIQSGDVGRAICAMLRAPALNHGMYNIAYGEPVSLGALSDMVCAVVPGARWSEADRAEGADIAGDPRRPGGAWGAYATDRLRGDTDWQPRPLEEALGDYADWMRRYELV